MTSILFSGQPSPAAYLLGASHQDLDVSERGAKLILQSNDKYMRDVRKRLDENAVAREQREKRLQRFMMEQIKAREAQEVELLFYLTLISVNFH